MITAGLVNVFTHDMDKALWFYTKLLEMTETFRTPDFGFPEQIEVTAGGFTLALTTVRTAEQAHGVPVQVGRPAVNLVFWVDDLDVTFEYLLGHGTPPVVAPHDSGGGQRRAVVHDPDGTLVELVELPAGATGGQDGT